MSSLTNINNNSAVVNVGRTTPVTPGVKSASQSIPVVIATDQAPIPVIEQQKIQSEVALSLLGIPRSEVALGIFSDVNTYDVNPSEWSFTPSEYSPGYGVQHKPEEGGAIIQADKDNLAVLSTKRFFRYQPGRVSAATFGVKTSISPSPVDPLGLAANSEKYDRNPAIRKYGIFDRYDGYYWETRGDGKGDNFSAIRRTQSLIKNNALAFTNAVGGQIRDYRTVGKQADDDAVEQNAEPKAIDTIQDNRFAIIAAAYNAALVYFNSGGAGVNATSYAHLFANRTKCERDASYAIDAYVLDLQYGGVGHSVTNATTYRTALLGSGDPQKTAAEVQLHTFLRDTLKTYLAAFTTLNGVSRNTRIDTICSHTISAVGGTQPLTATLISNSSSIWARNKILTIFAIYKKYLGYLVSESFTGDPTVYNPLKYKCARDVGYIVEGYARDLAYGGNSNTVYNMKNYYFNGALKVTTGFIGNTVLQFHERAHTILKLLISKPSPFASADVSGWFGWSAGTAINKGSSSAGFVSVFTLFDLQNATAVGTNKTLADKFNEDLATPLISNFATEYNGVMEFGSGSQPGDLIVLRDGLVHIHAAVYDPSLLKKSKKIAVKISAANNTIEASYGSYNVNQNIIFTGDATGLVNGKIYSVLSVSGAVLKLYDPDLFDINSTGKTEVEISSEGTANFIDPVTPFIFPRHYFLGPQPLSAENNYSLYSGMFPYMYAKPEDINTYDGTLEELVAVDPDPSSANYASNFIRRVGYINTSYDLTAPSGTENLRREIDYVNLLYNNWVAQNVDPRYFSVYEYRIPRSRFSGDKLDGVENRKVVYSDISSGEISSGNITSVQPGRSVLNGGVKLTSSSMWDLNHENVSMLKIEFSWYGAVGAMFLAYVPVGNGEARWVRVHHLRSSNQLKVSSLGNATLPITYLTYGGGSTKRLGILDDVDKSYNSTSNHIVKYGASYYIDGGDRGTVRLYSHTNNTNTPSYGKTFTIGTIQTVANSTFGGTYFTLSANTGPSDKTYFMKSQVITDSVQDQNVFVTWIDGDKVYINKPNLVSSSNVRLVSDRPSIAFGLKAKQSIFNSSGFGIRNRVQVYPTKMSTANFGTIPVKLDIMKTPLFQPAVNVNGSFILTSDYSVTSENLPLPNSSASYLSKDEDYIYGWFRSNVGTVFGKLYRDNGGQYYFELKEVFSVSVTLLSGYPFLKDGRFDFTGGIIFSGNTTANGVISESSIEKERLSSVYISNIIQTPIPGTGTINASFFIKPGSDQFDLLSYFDYNKDYLSYPLTDEVSSIYLATSSTNTRSLTPTAEVNVGLTWEEQ